ncbi:MAG: hypothetical protein PSX36_12865 [bacterium]|nr:hypothetical protein [bacterium]
MEAKELKKRIEKVYGQEVKYARDCDPLAIEISQSTGGTVSASTVKRLLGFVKTSSKPSQYTLDTIAIYLGFSDWNKLVSSENATVPNENGSTNKENEIEEVLITTKKVNSKIKKSVVAFSLIIILFLFFGWFSMSDSSTNYTQLPHLPELRNAGRAVSYDKAIYYVGGSDAVYVRNDNWKFDFDMKKWIELLAMPTARAEFGATIVISKIYCFGGWLGNDIGETDVAEAYDIQTNSWEKLPKLPAKITSANAVSIGSEVFIIGGTTGKTRTHFIKYDTRNKLYEELPAPKTQRLYCAMVTANGLIYAIGGNSFTDGEYKWLNNLSVYNPKNKIWTELAPLPLAITRSCALVRGNMIHIAGGSDGFGNDNGTIRNNHFVYDIQKNIWEEENPLPYIISVHQFIVHAGKLFLIGGTSQFPNPVNKFVLLN